MRRFGDFIEGGESTGQEREGTPYGGALGDCDLPFPFQRQYVQGNEMLCRGARKVASEACWNGVGAMRGHLQPSVSDIEAEGMVRLSQGVSERLRKDAGTVKTIAVDGQTPRGSVKEGNPFTSPNFRKAAISRDALSRPMRPIRKSPPFKNYARKRELRPAT